MPLEFRIEMVCDWRGAGRAQGKDDVIGFFQSNKQKMNMSDATREFVEDKLGIKELTK